MSALRRGMAAPQPSDDEATLTWAVRRGRPDPECRTYAPLQFQVAADLEPAQGNGQLPLLVFIADDRAVMPLGG